MASVLLLARDPRVQQRVTRALASTGHEVRAAAAPGGPADLVVVHGVGDPAACAAAVRAVTESEDPPPVLLLAPGRTQAYVAAAVDAGAYDCLPAPWGAATLRMAVSRAALEAERKRLAQRLAASRRMAVLGTLAAKVAHELNNPLDGITRFVNLAITRVQDDATTRDYLTRSRDGLKRMNRVVGSLLDFSRVAPADTAPAPLHEILEQAIGAVAVQAQEKRARIVTDLPDCLPETTHGDLFNVFRNLIHNALDAVDPGGTVRVRARADGDGAVVSVADDGCGMPEEVRRRVFEPFFTTKSAGRGTGLGLAICKDIAERISGTITVESAEGKGSTFTVALPEP
jgi:signal transduction histidine kinase